MVTECLTKHFISVKARVQGSWKICNLSGRASIPRLCQSKWGSPLSRGRYAQRSTVLRAVALKDKAETETAVEEEEFEDEDDGSGLTPQQVQTMLHVLCDETEVAELELKMGTFQMRVRRSAGAGRIAGSYSNGASSNGALSIPVDPASAFASTASMGSMDIPAPDSSSQQSAPVNASIDEDFEDESTIYLTAPKVGVMRRGRYVKGKRVGKGNVITEGDEVKKGQVLGFIEQLGTYVPVEAPQAGEIVAFVVEDGTAVEYNEPIVELMPFFGGHIIGDRKHA